MAGRPGGEAERLRDAMKRIVREAERRHRDVAAGKRSKDGCLPKHALLLRKTKKGWRLRQPHPGTRIIHYRCCLPALAEFANYRRGRTNGATVASV